jgi:hypothetical protein
MTLPPLTAQQSNADGNVSVPHLIRYSGVLKEVAGRPVQGKVQITFAFYKDEQGGEPLWMETQEVTLDGTGRYSVMLGTTTGDGLPQSLFQAGDAWWIEARAAGAAPPTRSLLAAVPYALKSVDSDTLAGRAAADYVTRDDLHSAVAAGVQAAQPDLQLHPMAGGTAVTGTGTAGFVPVWTGAATLGNSVISESGTKVGIGTTAPASTLDVNGISTLRGIVYLPAASAATATAGVSSPALKLGASTFSSATAAAVAQNFVVEAVSSGNNTAGPTAYLDWRFGSGGATATSTGLRINANGQLTFAAGQTFPGTGNGTITTVNPGTDMLGGGTSGAVTLGLDTTKVPQLNTANTFTGNQTVNGNVTSSGTISGSTVNATNGFNLGGTPFAFGSQTAGSSYFGFSGNQASTGSSNVGVGQYSMQYNAAGYENTAVGNTALYANTSGYANTALGNGALWGNTTGFGNTAVGSGSLPLYSGDTGIGSKNTALGYRAGAAGGNLSNTTTIGANASATISNALILGSINGVNGATADTMVGIGTTAPAAKLDVHGTANFTGLVTFASGQTFPGAGGGTITGITTSAGSGLKGGANSGNVSLSLDTAVTDARYPQLATDNIFQGYQVMSGGVAIGVPVPIYPLHVNGTIRSEVGGLSLGGFAPVVVDSNGVPGGRFTVLSKGNVGINNPDPQSALDVKGNVNATGSVAGGSLSVAGGASVGGSLTIEGDTPMSAAPHMYLTGFVPGPLGADVSVFPIFAIPSKNIIVTRMTSMGNNTCPNSGPLTFAAYAGGADSALLHSINLAPYTGTVNPTDSGPLSLPVAAGTPIQGIIQAPNCGSFGTAPSNIPVSIEYVMQ